MELRRHVSSCTIVALHVLVFIKSHMWVTWGHSVASGQQGTSSQHTAGSSSSSSGLLAASPDIQKDILELGPVKSVFYPGPTNPWGSSGSGGSERDKKWTEFNSIGKRRPDDEEDAADLGADNRWKTLAEWNKRSYEVPEKKWREMSVWGKRDDEIPEKKWKEMPVWGKRDTSPMKKWKEMAVWGKRDEIPEKKWKEMSVWGKRDVIPEKKWKEMSVWGKRDEIPDKKWKEMSVWGKRDDIPEKKWKEMSVWGKRDDIPEKKWKEMSVWGKRDEIPEKKWKEMSVWGKRNADMLAKRWKEMAVWGKRSDPTAKRWKAMPAWGKRSTGSTSTYATFRPIVPWRHIDTKWGKRPSWRRTGLHTWGKRSAPPGTWSRSYGARGQATERQRFQRWLHELRYFLLTPGQEESAQEFPREESSAEKSPGAAP